MPHGLRVRVPPYPLDKIREGGFLRVGKSKAKLLRGGTRKEIRFTSLTKLVEFPGSRNFSSDGEKNVLDRVQKIEQVYRICKIRDSLLPHTIDKIIYCDIIFLGGLPWTNLAKISSP